LVKYQEFTSNLADSFDHTLKQQLKLVLGETHFKKICEFLDEFETVKVKSKVPDNFDCLQNTMPDNDYKTI